MNASECCKTIGCNCGGTQIAEIFEKSNIIDFIQIIVLLSGILVVIYILWKDRGLWKNNNNQTKQEVSA